MASSSKDRASGLGEKKKPNGLYPAQREASARTATESAALNRVQAHFPLLPLDPIRVFFFSESFLPLQKRGHADSRRAIDFKKPRLVSDRACRNRAFASAGAATLILGQSAALKRIVSGVVNSCSLPNDGPSTHF